MKAMIGLGYLVGLVWAAEERPGSVAVSGGSVSDGPVSAGSVSAGATSRDLGLASSGSGGAPSADAPSGDLGSASSGLAGALCPGGVSDGAASFGFISAGAAPGGAASADPASAGQWKPVQGRIMTRWAAQVSPENVWPEYPRPTMVRPQWKNLNGLWDYAIRPKQEDRPGRWDGKILVPFCAESALSGVGKAVQPDQRLWYRRTFELPQDWTGGRVLLHFGAVDWEATVWLNGKPLGVHRGGYDAFSFDITDALHKQGPQELVLAVWDPTNTGTQPRGKQVLKPGGIWYTAVTGIWQTVWLEHVPASYIAALRNTPDADTGTVAVEVEVVGAQPGDRLRAVGLDGQKEAAQAEAEPGKPLVLKIPQPKLWSPENPFLYDLQVELLRQGQPVDQVRSYFGLRSVRLGKDENGLVRILLNGKFLFQMGTLDQGWWPDGLYTAPTDEALRYDLEVLKRLGMNMLRKHVKVEPERLYYWCDRLGILVWQDMPSGDRGIGGKAPDLQRSPESAAQFKQELQAMIRGRYNHPSIIMWVPYNEGWGQWNTVEVCQWIKQWDPTRLVNNASGWKDRGVGDVHDIHSYPGPAMPQPEPNRAIVLGEFGGLGLALPGHLWREEGAWGYRSFRNPQELTIAYLGLIEKLQPLVHAGLSAAVYTQTSDVEIEVNGLMTYDRAVLKPDERVVREAHRRLYLPPVIKTILPTSQQEGQIWRYTTEPPPAGWEKLDFDDSRWKSGPGGFGTAHTPGSVVRTQWDGKEIWLRRSFELEETDLKAPHALIHHDEDAEVYLNGQRVGAWQNYTTHYVMEPLNQNFLRAVRKGKNVLAVHCRQTIGGQYIDVGIVDVVRGQAMPAVAPPEKARTELRPPAVPLVVHDPYFSVWSFDDALYEGWTRHWTGAVHGMAGLIRVDGKPMRFMGRPLDVPPQAKGAAAAKSAPAAKGDSAAKDTPLSKEQPIPDVRQLSCQVLPTRTIYRFQAGPVELRLSFLTPALPDDLDVLARPVSYVIFEVQSQDGQPHQVELYFDATGQLAVNTPDQPVVWQRQEAAGDPPLQLLRIGTKEQPILQKRGDDLRIDWGYLYLAVPKVQDVATVIGPADRLRKCFTAGQPLPTEDDPRQPRAVQDDWPVLACAFHLGQVGQKRETRWLMLAYDDQYSIQYLEQNLRPWWRRDGLDAPGLLRRAAEQLPKLAQQCEAFDRALMADLEKVGGPGYAPFCALAYRQALGAHKLVQGPDGQLWAFSKECFSNGCIGTVDVIYPAAPILLLLNNQLHKAALRPVLHYAQSGRWKFPFAPHDLGTYPKANGQVYGGGEKSEENQMPVEESANMLILVAGAAKLDGHAEFAKPYWPLLDQWADYLRQKGLDPENQLCTDDFAGHLAHNVNLSAKAIVALACYAELCRMAGRDTEARSYRQLAEQFVQQWIRMADDGDHYRLAFDRPGTWSQKYNLVWDKIFALRLFPPEVVQKEIAFYKTKLNLFGLPLDNRSLYTKTDWHVWTATLADRQEDFEYLMRPVYEFVHFTLPRVPMTDWYWTHNAGRVGFQARPVIGGVFIRALADQAIWAKWAKRKG
jgi:hypothetical protein